MAFNEAIFLSFFPFLHAYGYLEKVVFGSSDPLSIPPFFFLLFLFFHQLENRSKTYITTRLL